MKSSFTIRAKITAIIIAAVVVLSASLYIVSSLLIERSYLAIEQSEMQKNIARSQDAVQNSLSSLALKLRDWSQWDDAYAYIQDRNQGFVDSNLQTQTLINLQLNIIAFLGTDGKLVYSATARLEGLSSTTEQDLIASILSHPTLARHTSAESSVVGIIETPEGMLAVASQPILTSLGKGPIKGAVIFARFFDQAQIKNIGTLTHLSLTLFPYSDISATPDVAHARTQFLRSPTFVTTPLSEENIAGYSLITDISNKPLAILKVETPREIYAQGRRTLVWFIGIASFFTILFGALILYLIQKFALARFARLSTEVAHIGTLHNLTLRVTTGAGDEVGNLAATINKMLVELASAQQKERGAQEREREAHKLEKQAVIQLKERLFEIERTNKYILDREMKLVEQQNKIAKLEEKISGAVPTGTPPIVTATQTPVPVVPPQTT